MPQNRNCDRSKIFSPQLSNIPIYRFAPYAPNESSKTRVANRQRDNNRQKHKIIIHRREIFIGPFRRWQESMVNGRK